MLTVDLARLRDRVAEARERSATANVGNRNLYQALEPVVGSHCPGLAAAPYHVHRYGVTAGPERLWWQHWPKFATARGQGSSQVVASPVPSKRVNATATVQHLAAVASRGCKLDQ